MEPDFVKLYGLMLKSRRFEEAVARLWEEGLIAGEMHLGTGEEAIAAGIVSQLLPGDALALDHRCTPPLLMRDLDPVHLLRELLGKPDGLNGGRAGHMHLCSKEHWAAASGIVGAAGPAAAGFALAAQSLRPGNIAVAFFGEGAMNQGHLLESLNLAAVWNLPVLFVCKDDQWSITTRSSSMTAGTLADRVNGLGVPYLETDGLAVERVWQDARKALERPRAGDGPMFIHAPCVHLEGHFLGFPLLRAVRRPLREMPRMTVSLLRSMLRGQGASWRERLAGMETVSGSIRDTWRDPRQGKENDPLVRARRLLNTDPGALAELEKAVEQEVESAVAKALQEAP